MWKWVGMAFIAALIAVTAVAWVASYTSLWVVWGLLPQYEQGQAGPRVAIDLGREQVREGAKVFGEMPWIDHAKNYGITTTEQGTTVVLLTGWGNGEDLAGLVRAQGGDEWQVEQWGPLVRATSAFEQAMPTIDGARDEWWEIMKTRDNPRWPVLLAETDEGITRAQWSVRGKELTLYMNDGEKFGEEEGFALANEAELFFSLSSGFLLSDSHLSSREELTGLLQERLDLVITPDYMEEWLSHETVQVALVNNEAAIGYWDSVVDELHGDAFERWLQAKEAETRLVPRSFELPDGTYGRELVPGEPVPIVTEESTGFACEQAIPEAGEYWLCENKGRAVLTTSRTLGETLLQLPEGRWYVVMDEGISERLPVAGIQRLFATGEPSRLKMIISL